MNILGCLDRPTSGELSIDGQDVSALNDNELAVMRNRKLGFVSQPYNLLPKLTAVGNVELPLIYSGGNHRRQHAPRCAGIGGHRPEGVSPPERDVRRRAAEGSHRPCPDKRPADNTRGRAYRQPGYSHKPQHYGAFNRAAQDKKGITVIVVTHEEDIAQFTQRTIYLRDGKIIEEKRR